MRKHILVVIVALALAVAMGGIANAAAGDNAWSAVTEIFSTNTTVIGPFTVNPISQYRVYINQLVADTMVNDSIQWLVQTKWDVEAVGKWHTVYTFPWVIDSSAYYPLECQGDFIGQIGDKMRIVAVYNATDSGLSPMNASAVSKYNIVVTDNSGWIGDITTREIFTIASGGTLGSNHLSSLARASAPFRLPTGIPFTVSIEPDVDSNAAWNADTFHIALVTAPVSSIAVDSAASGYNRWRWAMVKDFVMSKVHKANAMTYKFFYPPLDSVLAGGAATGDSTNTYVHNAISEGVGMFILSQDDADSTADAACGWRVYLTYRKEH